MNVNAGISDDWSDLVEDQIIGARKAFDTERAHRQKLEDEVGALALKMLKTRKLNRFSELFKRTPVIIIIIQFSNQTLHSIVQ